MAYIIILKLLDNNLECNVDRKRHMQSYPGKSSNFCHLYTFSSENQEFCTGLHKLVGGILKEREHHTYEAERWLSREAAKLDSVKKAGTFRYVLTLIMLEFNYCCTISHYCFYAMNAFYYYVIHL